MLTARASTWLCQDPTSAPGPKVWTPDSYQAVPASRKVSLTHDRTSFFSSSDLLNYPSIGTFCNTAGRDLHKGEFKELSELRTTCEHLMKEKEILGRMCESTSVTFCKPDRSNEFERFEQFLRQTTQLQIYHFEHLTDQVLFK